MFNPHGPEFWVLIAFLLFALMLIYYKVPGLVGRMLDERADVIRKELDDARRLREEAQQLLADYQRKSREAEAEAKSIVDQARREAENMAAEAKRNLADSLERRTKLAEEKITRAEAQAQAEVRGAAVDAAIAAAEKVLRGRMAGKTASDLIDENIRDLKGRLN